MSKPRLLDLFSGAGGAAMGYHRAGFEVVGVDNRPMPRYPFEFHQGEALEFLQAHGKEFDIIHASPPCQAYVKGFATCNHVLGRKLQHVGLVAATRELLIYTGLPYVIENVPRAPLRNPVQLCGSSFGLLVQRHRMFETSVWMMVPPCAHYLQNDPKYWTGWIKNGKRTKAKVVQVYGNGGERELWPEAMGIDWMKPSELAEAIPPAYTQYIGEQLMMYLGNEAA